MFFKICVQFIGFIGAAFGFIAYQNNNHKKIMLFKTASELTFALQFVLLRAYTGVAMNLIGCARNLVFADRVKKGKSTAAGIAVFSLMMAAAGALTWVGPVSLLAILGKIASTLAYGMKRPKLVRLLTLPSSALWIVYDAICLSAAGVLTEIFTVASITIAEIRFRKKKAEKESAKKRARKSLPTGTKAGRSFPAPPKALQCLSARKRPRTKRPLPYKNQTKKSPRERFP